MHSKKHLKLTQSSSHTQNEKLLATPCEGHELSCFMYQFKIGLKSFRV